MSVCVCVCVRVSFYLKKCMFFLTHVELGRHQLMPGPPCMRSEDKRSHIQAKEGATIRWDECRKRGKKEAAKVGLKAHSGKPGGRVS